MAAGNNIQLYTLFNSHCSYRLRIALAWKHIDYTSVPINLMKGEHQSPDYTKINPLQQVPTLSIDGHVLTQTLAIMEYLEEKFPDRPSYFPRDLLQKARVRQIAQIICSAGLQPFGISAIVDQLVADPTKKAEKMTSLVAKTCNAVEKALEETSGKYCVGDEVTMADFCLVPFLVYNERFNVPVDNYPNIHRITTSLKQLEAFKKAEPSAQPDCPAEMKIKK